MLLAESLDEFFQKLRQLPLTYLFLFLFFKSYLFLMQVPASIGRRICGAAILTSPQQKGEYPRLESAQCRVFWPRYETNCKDALAAYTVKKYATRTGVVPLMGRESQGHSASMVNGAASKTSGSFVSTFGETDKKEVGLGGVTKSARSIKKKYPNYPARPMFVLQTWGHKRSDSPVRQSSTKSKAAGLQI